MTETIWIEYNVLVTFIIWWLTSDDLIIGIEFESLYTNCWRIHLESCVIFLCKIENLCEKNFCSVIYFRQVMECFQPSQLTRFKTKNSTKIKSTNSNPWGEETFEVNHILRRVTRGGKTIDKFDMVYLKNQSKNDRYDKCMIRLTLSLDLTVAVTMRPSMDALSRQQILFLAPFYRLWWWFLCLDAYKLDKFFLRHRW